ncbi:MAG: Chromosomal replication initiator protein DnaA [candidate division TM6 bacterium GW2011_GWF2_32_72]|nr:MAG: Chromosomal replication initiator protein DnaA [candidate division TM6 bacterium GW2011_GWF2_32_72]
MLGTSVKLRKIIVPLTIFVELLVIKGIWEEFLKIAKEEAGSRVVETWLKAITFQEWDAINKIASLKAPNDFVRNWVEKNYMNLLTINLSRLFNVDKVSVIFESENKKEELLGSALTCAKSVEVTPALTMIPATVIKPSKQSTKTKSAVVANRNFDSYLFGLNKAHSFSAYVLGESNSLAYSAARAVAENPGKLYNPLLIYGGPGLGKTHLIHAIGNHVKELFPKSNVLYQTADRFVSEFISAIRFDKMHQFQAKYRTIDVLLIDDIQFIANKEQSQEAFFHVFNYLYEAKKQVVLTCDVLPGEIKGLADRLRSRLEWGMVTDIQPPEQAMKIEILKRKVQVSTEEHVEEAVLSFIASRFKGNVRELEGGLIRVLAFANLTKQPITMDLAQKVLQKVPEKQNGPCAGLDLIAKEVCKQYAVELNDLKCQGRRKEVAFARQVAMFMMKQLTNKSLKEIGSFFGKKDHSTVLHACSKIEEMQKLDPLFSHQYKTIKNHILNG